MFSMHNISKVFRTDLIETHALRDFSLEVSEGEFVAVTCPWGNRFRCYAPGPFGPMTLGMPYVELDVPRGTAASIQRFYEQAFGAPGRLDAGAAVVDAGPNQSLIFRETNDVPDYDGHHVAIYVANFSGPLQWLEERELVSQGIRNHQFRFQDIADPDSGKVVFALEHEVRSMRHPGYKRVLVNRDPDGPAMFAN